MKSLKSKILALLFISVFTTICLVAINFYSLYLTSGLLRKTEDIQRIIQGISDIESKKNRFVIDMSRQKADEVTEAIIQIKEFSSDYPIGLDTYSENFTILSEKSMGLKQKFTRQNQKLLNLSIKIKALFLLD